MLTSTLRNVGGSVMVAIPKPVLESLGLAANEKVGLRIEDGHLIIEPRSKPRYSLEALIAECDVTAPDTDLDDWNDVVPVGREAI